MQAKELIIRQVQSLIKQTLIQLDQVDLPAAQRAVVRKLIIRIAFDSAIMAGRITLERVE